MLKMKQTEKVYSIINIEVYLIVILCLFDVLQKPLIGYFKYLNLEELSTQSFNGHKIDGVKRGKEKKKSSENMFFIFFHLILGDY